MGRAGEDSAGVCRSPEAVEQCGGGGGLRPLGTVGSWALLGSFTCMSKWF